MNPLARDLNQTLETAAPEVFASLSALGRRLYFPRGILSQSAEANARANRVNATIGIATEAGGPMYLPSIQRHLANVDPKDAYPYASVAGRPGLRDLWREKLLAENPSLAGKRFGRPIVTSAITHGLALVGDLFVDPGDVLVLPDKLWGNYRLMYEVRYGGRIVTFPFFDGGGFATGAFARALEEQARTNEKLLVLLNFPNNPTGYMPTPPEAEAIASAIVERAERGTKIVAICDDAYFGLFYHLGGATAVESLFSSLANRHPNLLAVKLDGATKELFVWGLRCGFLTFGPGRANTAEAVADVLDAKVRGAVRSGISNSPQLSQSLVERALSSPTIEDERKQKFETLAARAAKVHEVVHAPRYRESWEPYPFNSGYFMCIAVKGVEAEKVRVHLLERYGMGVIATGASDLRIAFSCVELGDVESLFETLHRAIQELQ
ncbi:MAG: aminotransferase class I/II-fold pyridoxal phosphate-dependent enzyme [Deltaproteobacteria bacterium]|nr:MAG: aminotransferase class I/II-fold pyridoxal phosphate-dependent enzyme [Deltaproteobacteria bacterium]